MHLAAEYNPVDIDGNEDPSCEVIESKVVIGVTVLTGRPFAYRLGYDQWLLSIAWSSAAERMTWRSKRHRHCKADVAINFTMRDACSEGDSRKEQTACKDRSKEESQHY